MSSHTDLCAVVAGNSYFINEIFIRCDKHRSKLDLVQINDKKDTKFNPWHSSELLGIPQLFPYQEWPYLQYRNASLQYIQPGFSACTFNCWIWVVFWKRRWIWPLHMWPQFVLCSDFDHELNSRVDWRREARKHTSCVSQVSTSSVALSKDIQSTVVFELTSGLFHAKYRLLCFW